jgi:hypothetical protein
VQADCLAAGGLWEVKTPATSVNSCVGYDVDNDANCSKAGGTYAVVSVHTGGISPAGLQGLPAGINQLRIQENSYNDPIFPVLGSQFLKITTTMKINDYGYTTTYWSGAVSLVNAKQSGNVIHDTELDLLYFNAKFVDSIPANYSDFGINFGATVYFKN